MKITLTTNEFNATADVGPDTIKEIISAFARGIEKQAAALTTGTPKTALEESKEAQPVISYAGGRNRSLSNLHTPAPNPMRGSMSS